MLAKRAPRRVGAPDLCARSVFAARVATSLFWSSVVPKLAADTVLPHAMHLKMLIHTSLRRYRSFEMPRREWFH